MPTNAGQGRYCIVREVADLVRWATKDVRLPTARNAVAREVEDNADSDDDDGDGEVDSEGDVASESDEDDIDDADLGNAGNGGRLGMQLCADNLGWGAGYAYGSGRTSYGDWRHLDRAPWVTMYLIWDCVGICTAIGQ